MTCPKGVGTSKISELPFFKTAVPTRACHMALAIQSVQLSSLPLNPMLKVFTSAGSQSFQTIHDELQPPDLVEPHSGWRRDLGHCPPELFRCHCLIPAWGASCFIFCKQHIFLLYIKLTWASVMMLLQLLQSSGAPIPFELSSHTLTPSHLQFHNPNTHHGIQQQATHMLYGFFFLTECKTYQSHTTLGILSFFCCFF